MKKQNIQSERGYTAIEAMIVVVITALLVTFAIGRFGNSATQFQRQNIARELKVYLERARFDSVKRRAVSAADLAYVQITGATSFKVKTDVNQNGTLDASDLQTIDFSTVANGVTITGNSLVFPITITFDRYGRITAKDGTLPIPRDITPLFTVCTGGCTPASATAATGDVVYVSPSGTVAMLTGGSSQPSYTSPNVSTVTASVNLNPDMQVEP